MPFAAAVTPSEEKEGIAKRGKEEKNEKEAPRHPEKVSQIFNRNFNREGIPNLTGRGNVTRLAWLLGVASAISKKSLKTIKKPAEIREIGWNCEGANKDRNSKPLDREERVE